MVRKHREAIEDWINELIVEKVCISDESTFRTLKKDWPIFAITKKGRYWRKMAFRDKKYKDAEGNTVHDYCQQQNLNVSVFYLWRKKLAAESENVSAVDWLSLPAADLPGHTGDWQIELPLPGGVTLRMNSTA